MPTRNRKIALVGGGSADSMSQAGEALTLADHVRRVALENDVAVEEIPGFYRGRAWRSRRTIRIAPVKSGSTYAIALHELGHILGPQTGNRLNREWQAWAWAKAHALEWTAVMDQKMQSALQSYLRWCNRRKGAWVPPPDHPVWLWAQIAPAAISPRR